MPPLLATILRRPLTVDCWRETLYLVVAFITGLIGFIWMVSAVSTTLGLMILIVGLPLAVLIAYVDRWWCGTERALAGLVLRRPVIGHYTPARGANWVTRRLSILRDRQTWLDGLWMLVAFPLSLIGFILVVTVWAVAFSLLFAPLYGWSLTGSWLAHHVLLFSIAGPFAGVLAAVAAAWIVRGWALAQATVASWLLEPDRTKTLERRVRTLAETRAGAVDAAVSELQRVERDLHDGAQARLVALAMDLGLAEQRLAGADPETALEHVANARGQARAAMAELRDLVRGIGPSILHDHGLDAALTALVSGRNPPVDLRVELHAGGAGPREAGAYFVVAEAIANARKHAQASRISVHAWEEADEALIVEVVDDGLGGADPDAGSGLNGLRKRVAALDGTLAIDSPPGGPTRIRAEFPCGS